MITDAAWRTGRATVAGLTVAACLVAGAPNHALPVPVRFVRERVELHLGPSDFLVEGRYGFVRVRRGAVDLDYPFPVDSTLGEPRLIGVYAAADGRPVPARVRWTRGASVRLAIDAPSGKRIETGVLYRQPLLARRAVYLLTTTRRWGRPLAHATLEVDWPDSLGTPRFSLPFAIVSRDSTHTLYRFVATQFLPDTDLVVSW